MSQSGRRSIAPAALAFALALVTAGAAGLGCSRSQASPEQGREIFANNCARCHNADGSGGLPVAPGGPSPRNFRDHDFQASRTDEQLKQTIVNGKGTAMPPFGVAFTEVQLSSLVAQIRSFDPAPR
jgi:mono/diheme cytochrome c family protein